MSIIEDFLVITDRRRITLVKVITNYGRQLLQQQRHQLTGLVTGTGHAQVRRQGPVTRLILACLAHVTCTQPMNVEPVGMTWLTCVISCLSDQQAIMTWQERALTGTRISQRRGRAVGVTFYPGGNVNIAKHVMRIH